jgi:hypothetical protein
MNTKLLVAFGIAILLVGLILGFPIGRGCSKPCPEIIVGKDTVLVQVIVHDTVVSYITRDSIKVVKEFQVFVDTIFDTINNVQTFDTTKDSTNCYSFDETEKDGAYIEAKVCSDSFPEEKPLDLKASILYLAPPDSIKTIFRVDTALRTLPAKPVYKDWKFYAGMALTFVGGFLVGNRL